MCSIFLGSLINFGLTSLSRWLDIVKKLWFYVHFGQKSWIVSSLDVGFTKTPPNLGKHNLSFTHFISAIGAGTSPRANSIIAFDFLVSLDKINKNSYILKREKYPLYWLYHQKVEKTNFLNNGQNTLFRVLVE